MQLTILGSGTSTGVPIPTCNCYVCTSNHKEDKRTRASILIEHKNNYIIVDTGPDFRLQALKYKLQSLDAVLYTHHHYDHIAGLNDLRAYSHFGRKPLNMWCTQTTLKHILSSYSYTVKNMIPGQTQLKVNHYTQKKNLYNSFAINDIHIQPIQLFHDNNTLFETIGFVFNKKVAYLTDFKIIEKSYFPLLENLDILILGSPVFKLHPTHISIPEAIQLIDTFKPKKAIITHLGHESLHKELLTSFQENVKPAYDNMKVFHES